VVKMTLLLVSVSVSQSLTRTKTTNSDISHTEEDVGSLSFICSQEFKAIMGTFGGLKYVLYRYRDNECCAC
jgi:hypothetical protein